MFCNALVNTRKLNLEIFFFWNVAENVASYSCNAIGRWLSRGRTKNARHREPFFDVEMYARFIAFYLR